MSTSCIELEIPFIFPSPDTTMTRHNHSSSTVIIVHLFHHPLSVPIGHKSMAKGQIMIYKRGHGIIQITLRCEGNMTTEKSVTVVATIKVKEDMVDSVKKKLEGLVTATVKEEGCINYNLHQSLDDRSLFIIYENWESRDALDRHMASPHFKAWREKGKDLLADIPQVTLCRKIR